MIFCIYITIFNMEKLMKRSKIKIDFLTFMFITSLILTATKYTFIAFLCAAIHEAGHIFAAKLLSVKLSEFNLSFLGARLRMSDRLYSYKQEIILCIMGPLFNFISVVLLLPSVTRLNNENMIFFIMSSLFLGFINLLPIKTFDGGRIFECILLLVLDDRWTERILNITSFVLIFSLWCISIYMLLIYSSSLNLFVFSISIFFTIFMKQ